MPWPVSSRFAIDPGTTPAAFHSASSFVSVPEPSPRDTKLPPAAMAFMTSISGFPLAPAGSPAGPMIRKSLYMIRRPSMMSPLWMYLRSASGAWTRTASASPRRAISSAAPVPTAMGFTAMPVSCWNIGSRESSSPVSCVLVVVASTISCCWACSSDPASRRVSRPTWKARSARRMGFTLSEDDLELRQPGTSRDARIAGSSGDVLERDPGGPPPWPDVRAKRPRLQRNGRNGPALELLVLHHGLQPRHHRRCRENVPAVVVVSTDVEGLADEL